MDLSVRRRVVVTGMGVVTPIGNCVEAFSEALLRGTSGVGPIRLFDPASLPTRFAAVVEGETLFRDRKVSFALKAAEEAVADAGSLPEGSGGLSLGIGLELFSMEDLFRYRRPGFRLPEGTEERLTCLQTPSDLCLHEISWRHGVTQVPIPHVSACAAGTDAIGTAFRRIASGHSDWMLAGGTDSMINPLGVGGFCKLRALSTRNERPEEASRPFDRTRDGFVLGEGAAVLLLESREQALARGAAVWAEILGYGNSFDAHGISEPHPQGRGACMAMRGALEEARLAPEAVDCINAHGTGTPKNDPVETLAIKQVFGAHAYRMPVYSVKSMIGHLIAAAGAVEAVAAILALKGGWVPPTINLTEPDPTCDLDYVPGQARRLEHAVVLSNSFGFGGQNASIVIGGAILA